MLFARIQQVGDSASNDHQLITKRTQHVQRFNQYGTSLIFVADIHATMSLLVELSDCCSKVVLINR